MQQFLDDLGYTFKRFVYWLILLQPLLFLTWGLLVMRGFISNPKPITSGFIIIIFGVGYYGSVIVCGEYKYRKELPEIRRKQGLCVACGYDLKANISGLCPECGTTTTRPQ